MREVRESFRWCDQCQGKHHLWGPKQRALLAWFEGDGVKEKLRDARLLNEWRLGKRQWVGVAKRGKKVNVARHISATYTGKFQVSVTVRGLPFDKRRTKHIGTYATPKEAIAARDQAEGAA